LGGGNGLDTQPLPLLERCQAGLTDDRRVDEDVLKPVVGLDEPEALGRVEPFDLAQHAHRIRVIDARTPLRPGRGISEAPLQLKSNCGTFVIDDFGRQRMPVTELLNRWIVPLEKRYDFLNLPSGKKVQVPFDQFIIFSTNLEPKDLVDGAFLRRIPYKIEVLDPTEEEFRKLFSLVAPGQGFQMDRESLDAIDYLIETHYKAKNRPFRSCQPRDLLLQVRNFCLYKSLPRRITPTSFDFACDNYFSVM